MTRCLIFLFCLMAFTIRVKAQFQTGIYVDSTTSKKYANDTLGFAPYPEAFLFNHIKPAKKFIALEVNIWMNNIYPTLKTFYKNVYRYPEDREKYQINDTTVLSKIDPGKSFIASDYQPWYVSVKYKNNDVINIGDTTAVKTFLGKISNEYNACLWFYVKGVLSSSEVPIKTAAYLRYKKVKRGFLITYRSEIYRGPEGAVGDLTYFIGEDFKIWLVSTTHIRLRQKGDIIYKI